MEADGHRGVIGRLVSPLVLVAAILALWAAPAGAHGDAVLTLHGDGRGSVWLTAAWEDGHPIAEPVDATVTAKSTSGFFVGPTPLQKQGETYTYSSTLPPGEWTVVAQMRTPASGHCEATMNVSAAGGSPTDVRCAPSPAVASRSFFVNALMAAGLLGFGVFVVMLVLRRVRAERQAGAGRSSPR